MTEQQQRDQRSDQRKIRILKWEVRGIHLERIIMVKLLILIGIIAAAVLPGQAAAAVSIAANAIWLFKT